MTKTLFGLFSFLKRNEYPKCLRINGKPKLQTLDFQEHDKLYRAYTLEDLDEREQIKLNSIRFPEYSCNWDRFSKPEHIRYRRNGSQSDGCYSIAVLVARFESKATPVHEPLVDDPEYPNYAHVDVRELYKEENILYEPPRGRRSKISKSQKARYRHNLVSNLIIELNAE